jgi:hypothetical protein
MRPHECLIFLEGAQGLLFNEGNYIYIYKQGWKSIHKKYKALRSKCKQTKGKPRPSKTIKDHQNNNNEVEDKDVMLKGHPLPQLASDGGALAGMCGRYEELQWLGHVVKLLTFLVYNEI